MFLREGDEFVVEEVAETEGQRSLVTLRKGSVRSSNGNGIVSARGSYLMDTADREFPLRTVIDDHRYPAYSLIGRIGEDGKPFYIGERFEGAAESTGELYLSINDPAPSGNEGFFLVSARRAMLSATAYNPYGPGHNPGYYLKENQSGAASQNDYTESLPDNPLVVIYFIDGLRPDVLLEMAEWGHMPTFKRIFLDGGSRVRNAFTLLPSHTCTSFTSMITGMFADKHGLKSQVFYNPHTGRYFDGLNTRSFSIFAAAVRRRHAVALYDLFPRSFGAGALPVQRRSPETLYANLGEFGHRAINTANYGSNIINEIDAVQTRFALDMAAMPEIELMLVWLPLNDLDAARHPNGQFGRTRKVIAELDGHFAAIERRLKERGRLDNTIFVLFSDHGHVGGEDLHNEPFDLERDIIHPRLRIGAWSWYHRNPFPSPEVPRSSFAAISDADGGAGVTLPYRSADSGDMKTRNTWSELSNYQLADGTGTVNTLDIFTEHRKSRSVIGGSDKPVDMVVAMVDDNTVIVQRAVDCRALIHRTEKDGPMLFRYEPLRDGGQADDCDPLGYLRCDNFIRDAGRIAAEQGQELAEWLEGWHTGREWLTATAFCEYPGAVEAMNRYFHMHPDFAGTDQRAVQPDMLVFASPGWLFQPYQSLGDRKDKDVGMKHGHAVRQAAQICMFFAGPGIKRGHIVEEPGLIVDIMPTVLKIMNKETPDGIDGVAIRSIFANENGK